MVEAVDELYALEAPARLDFPETAYRHVYPKRESMAQKVEAIAFNVLFISPSRMTARPRPVRDDWESKRVHML